MNDIDWWNTIIKVNILGNNNISFYVTYHLFSGVGLFNVFVVEVVKFNRLYISLLSAKRRNQISQESLWVIYSLRCWGLTRNK